MWIRMVIVALCVAVAGGVPSAPASGQTPPSPRCDSTDIDPQTSQPCLAIGKFSSPAGAVATFTSDIPGGSTFQLTGEEAAGVFPNDPNAVVKFADIAPGTYTITETPPAGYAVQTVACDGQFSTGAVQLGTNSITITLGAGEWATCDFANSQHQIEIVKVADVKDGTDFPFTATLGDFTLDDAVPDDADANTSAQTFAAPARTPVSFTEQVPDGWQLTSISCDPGDLRDPQGLDATTIDVDLAAASVTIEIDDWYARSIVCTFTNTRTPSPSTSTTTSTTTTSTTVAPAPTTTTPPPVLDPTDVLPETGSRPVVSAWIGALLLALGGVAMLTARRGRRI